MPNPPLVSIITPSYNQVAYLEQTIQSVLAQDYQPVEYLIIDGASQDGSVDIIQEYSEQINWWVSEADKGQAEAINKGLARAKGEIVAWLNSDDLLLPGAISQAVDALGKYPEAGMVFGDAITIDPGGRPLNRLTFGDWGLRELMRFQIICQPAAFMRRSILQKAGHLDPSFHYMLDHELWLRIASLGSVKHVNQLWAAARHHPGAKNVAQPAGFSQETLQLLTWIKNQPDLAESVEHDRRHILGGAYRLIARYFLDGGMGKESLKYYLRALRHWPNYTLKHSHRMGYAILLMLNIPGLAEPIRLRQSLKGREQLTAELKHQFSGNLSSKVTQEGDPWPGLCLKF